MEQLRGILVPLAAAASTAIAAARIVRRTRPVGKECKANSDKREKYKHSGRVLVTGFFDWRGLGKPANLWRLRENPSGQLILGACDSPPLGGARPGALAKLLRDRFQDVTFCVLPVLWGTARSLDLRQYNAVVHIGLGVYDATDYIVVEDGAYNLRKGADAVGCPGAGPFRPESKGQFFMDEAMSKRVRALAGCTVQSMGQEFKIVVKGPRKSNTYICNETHWRALECVREARRVQGRLKAVFFVHIPYPKGGAGCDIRPLAGAVSAVVESLVTELPIRA